MNNLFNVLGRFKLLYRISAFGWLIIMTTILAFWTLNFSKNYH